MDEDANSHALWCFGHGLANCRIATSIVFVDGAEALWLDSKVSDSLLVHFLLLHSDSVALRQQCDMRLPAD